MFQQATLAGLHQARTQSSRHIGWTWRGTDLLYMFQQGTLVGQRSVTQRNRASASRWSPLASAISARIMRSTSRLLLSSQRLHTGTGQVGPLKLGSQSQSGVQIQRLHGTSTAGAQPRVHAQRSRAGDPEAHSYTVLALSDGQGTPSVQSEPGRPHKFNAYWHMPDGPCAQPAGSQQVTAMLPRYSQPLFMSDASE